MKRTRLLLISILEHSTALPFRKVGQTFRCFYCHTNIYFATELRSHYAEKHKNENVIVWVKRNVTKRYFLVKLDITDLSCKICSQKIADLQELAVHLRAHGIILGKDFDNIVSFKLSDYEFKCTYCAKQYSFFPQLYSHIHQEHLKKPCICAVCGLGFVDDRNLSSHMKKHADKNKFFHCNVCERKFIEAANLNNHMKRSHGDNRCHICNLTLKSEFRKENHMAKEHDFYIREFKCDLCPRKFILNKLLVTHIKNQHLKEKNKACDVCGARFFDMARLNQHKIKHSDKKPFKCDTCDKTFARRKTYRQHLRIHSDERNYVCEKCDKAYVHYSSLAWHKQKHGKDEGKEQNLKDTKKTTTCSNTTAMEKKSTLGKNLNTEHKLDFQGDEKQANGVQ